MRFALLVLLCTLGLAAQDVALPLDSVRAEGSAIPQAVIMELAGLRIGTPIDKAGIGAACLKLEQTGLFASINYRYASGPNQGYTLTLALVEQTPLIEATIDIPNADDAEAWQWLVARFHRFDHQIPQIEIALQFFTRELERHLAASLGGQHLTARLESDLKTRKLTVSFQPEVLPRVRTVTFSGNQAITTAKLQDVLTRIVANQDYTKRGFASAIELNLRPLYEEHGYYRVRFAPGAPQLSRSEAGGNVAIDVAVSEGAPYLLGKVEVVDDNLPLVAMLAAAKFQNGKLANWEEIQKSLWAMEKVVKRTGFNAAASVPERRFDDAAHVLDLRVRIVKGPLFHWGQLSVTGLSPAQEAIARKTWRPKVGDPYDFLYPGEFFQALAGATNLGGFRKYDTAIRPAPAPADHVMNVTLVFEPR